MKKKSQDFSWKYSSYIEQSPVDGYSVIDVVRTSFVPGSHIKKISKNEYIKGSYRGDGSFVPSFVSCDNLETGSSSDLIEVFSFSEKNTPFRNRRSLRHIFRKLRMLITSNFHGGDSELFLTLTYAHQTNDTVQIHSDLVKFWKRLKYRYSNLKYIAIVEPHASGMYHIHMLLADTLGYPLFIPHSELEAIWGLGFVSIDRISDVDHMGAYFIAYFSNLELSPDQIADYEADGDIIEKNGKKFIKGKRLDFYPDHMQIYRYSRNINKPVVSKDSLDFDLSSSELRYSKDTVFSQNGNDYHIFTAQYLKKK